MFIAIRARITEHNILFTFLVSATTIFVFVGGYALFLQAERASPQLQLSRNWKAWFILGCYAILVKSTIFIISVKLTRWQGSGLSNIDRQACSDLGVEAKTHTTKRRHCSTGML